MVHDVGIKSGVVDDVGIKSGVVDFHLHSVDVGVDVVDVGVDVVDVDDVDVIVIAAGTGGRAAVRSASGMRRCG